MKAQSGAKRKRRGATGNGRYDLRAALTVRPAGPGDRVPLGFFLDSVLRKDYFIRRGQLDDILSGKEIVGSMTRPTRLHGCHSKIRCPQGFGVQVESSGILRRT